MKYIIERKVNPLDEWMPYKKFENKIIAEQSLSTLRKMLLRGRL